MSPRRRARRLDEVPTTADQGERRGVSLLRRLNGKLRALVSRPKRPKDANAGSSDIAVVEKRASVTDGALEQQGAVAWLVLDELRGAIFDLDGVLTDTARLHRRAWAETFNAYFSALGGVEAFTDEDYLRLVDGRLRLDGARAVIADRRIDLPEGEEGDGPEVASIVGLAARKDARYQELLESEGPAPYASSLLLLKRLHAAGLLLAVATASRHARRVLELAEISDELEVVVDGRAAQSMGLAGKPAPDTYLEAARRLGLDPGRCVVFEDASSGVAAGRAAGCYVVGIDRGGQHQMLESAGADVVVGDLGELTLKGDGPASDPRLFIDADVDDDREGVRESLFALGNGYLMTRGARTDVRDDGKHYPGTYIAGIFDRLHGEVEGHVLDEDAIVNAPNWLALAFSTEEHEPASSDQHLVLRRGAVLDMGAGVLERRSVVIDGEGRRTTVVERRLVCMHEPHLAALEVELVAENWSGTLELRLGIDGTVRDAETLEERLLFGPHLQQLRSGDLEQDGIFSTVRTVQSDVTIATALRARAEGNVITAWTEAHENVVERHLRMSVAENERVHCEKVAAIYTSRDRAVSDPLEAARRALHHAGDVGELLSAHTAEWSRIWRQAALVVHDETTAIQRLVYLHLFHVLQVASRNVANRDVGVPARGLHGEGYLGHVFWDELFVLPILTRRFPGVTRSLLSYRTQRLDAARDAARDSGYRGAMFPWQSATDGRDETPTALYNPRSGHWMEDRSRFQRHVGLAIAHNFWQYFQMTGDSEQLFESGLEVMTEIARFFADLATYDSELDRYHIRNVVGPDEFHDGYPWSDAPGVDDNAYTNVMTAWLLERIGGLVELARQNGRTNTLERLALTTEELGRMSEISRRLHVPFMGDVISQFEGYDRLEPIDLEAYRARYGDIARLDLILEAEGDAVRRYQVAKQPDVLMLLYLFSAEELRGVLGRLGYTLSAEAIRHTIEYYRARVTHGSSLSRVVHAWITARLDRRSSWDYLVDALTSDVLDRNAGTTREGVHLGAMAGTIDIFERCYTGLEFRADALWLNPSLPEEIAALHFDLNYRGHRLKVAITHDRVEVSASPGVASPVTLLVSGEPYTLHAGGLLTHEFARSRQSGMRGAS